MLGTPKLILQTVKTKNELSQNADVLSCQSRVIVTSCYVYEVIRDLGSIDHLCINTIHRINTQVIYRFALAQVECTSQYFT